MGIPEEQDKNNNTSSELTMTTTTTTTETTNNNDNDKNMDEKTTMESVHPDSNNNSTTGITSIIIKSNNRQQRNSSLLDETWYYYQNPKTGTVSSNPLTVRQLCKLFCPVREGMIPILPSHTRCLPVLQSLPETTTTTTTTTSNEQDQNQQQQQVSFGDWKLASELDILREASSNQWYINITTSSSSTSSTTDSNSSTNTNTTKGPLSCRGILEEQQRLVKDNDKNGTTTSSSDATTTTTITIMAYAKDITPQWTLLSKLENLQYALEAITVQQPQQQQQTESFETINTKQQIQSDANDSTTTTTTAATAGNAQEASSSPSFMSQEMKDQEQQIQDELEAFLSATVGTSTSTTKTTKKNNDNNDNDDDNDDHTYESDGGTKYIQDPMTGKWIHEALVPESAITNNTNNNNSNNSNNTSKQQSKQNNNNNNVNNTNANNTTIPKKKSGPKKAKFTKRNAKHWIYVTGLPTTPPQSDTVTEESLAKFFGKVGLLDLDPETLQPKIKLYRNHNKTNNHQQSLKGDASICYARPESVELALQILDESSWDDQSKYIIRVQRAKFEAKHQQQQQQNDDSNKNNKRSHDEIQSNNDNNNNTNVIIHHPRKQPVSQAKRKVARLALRQAQDEGFGERLAGGRKGLRIIVVKHMIPETNNDNKDDNNGIHNDQLLEEFLHGECEKFGPVEKITVIEKTQVVIIKFLEPMAAFHAIQAWNGQEAPKPKYWQKLSQSQSLSRTAAASSHNNSSSSSSSFGKKKKMKAIYWDGVTDYTHKGEDDLEEEEKRHEEFGQWLETQREEELPPELRLRVEGDDDNGDNDNNNNSNGEDENKDQRVEQENMEES